MDDTSAHVPVTWPPLGTTAPEMPDAAAPILRSDLGPGGSLEQEADRLARFAAARGLRRGRRATDQISRLRAQAEVERYVASALDDVLPGAGWVALHDRLLPGTEHRVAHVLVGPPGIAITTAVPAAGAWHVADGALFVGTWISEPWFETRRWEAGKLVTSVALAAPHASCMVHPVALVAPERGRNRWKRRKDWTAAGIHHPLTWRHVTIRTVDTLMPTLTALPAPLARSAVAHLADVVEHLCPPAGIQPP